MRRVRTANGMKVLYFSADYGPHDHRFLAALAKTSHKVYFLRLAGPGRQTDGRPVPAAVEELRWAGGKGPFRWSHVPRLVRDLKRLVRDVQPDLIHAGPIQTCAFLAALSGFRPILTMSWGFDLMQDVDRNAWWRWITRYTLRHSDFFVSDARVTQAKAIAYGMPSRKTAVFPWGVDLDQFSPKRLPTVAGLTSIRQKKAGPKGPHGSSEREARFIVFCNRSWEPRYGVDVLARAFVLAARKHAGLDLILLGGGSQADIIRQILVDGGVIDRVTFGRHVAQSELPRWYRKADVFVTPSHVDGSSVSLLEALACGRPVLASAIPANKEWVREGVNGWLFRDGDSEELAEKLLWISSHRSSLARTGREARRVAVLRADWTKNFRVLLHSYQRALVAG